jgi:hypothetical protein
MNPCLIVAATQLIALSGAGDSTKLGAVFRKGGIAMHRCAVALTGALLAAAPGVAAAAPSTRPEGGTAAQELATEEAQPAPEGGLQLDVGFEVKSNVRASQENRFPVPFPFPPSFLPPGETRAFEETVNEGTHVELSTLTVLLDATWSDALAAHAKVDFIDLYDRNPTSSDQQVDVDEAWLRLGRETPPAQVSERVGVYLKVGKFGHFERQNDRHLESYGLVSTAFNRFEDTGVEVGVDLGHLYFKLSATQGNPLFMRDPNALAGDNGTPAARQPNPDPELKTGIVILYDAEVESLDVDGDLELGGGVGLRYGGAAGRVEVDILGWSYERKLAETVELQGTFYGGDLDLLDGPFGLTPLPVTDDKKREVGGNLWLYLGGFSLFGQYVDQEIGGLPRTGAEAEVAWSFDLPLAAAVAGRQLFPSIAPAVRWSHLDPGFKSHPLTPAPSWSWDWTRIDGGLRVVVISGIDLTLEYADNDFTLASGRKASNNEFLATLRWRV